MFPCMKMYIVFLNFLCFSPFYSLKEKQKIKSYDIKNCYLLSPIMKIEIMKPTQSKSKSSLVLPNTINQSILLCYYVLQCTEKENWNKELRSVFSTSSVSIYKTVKYRFFLMKRGILILDSIEVSILACHAGDRGSIPRRGGVLFFENCWTIKICSVLKNLEVTTLKIRQVPKIF